MPDIISTFHTLSTPPADLHALVDEAIDSTEMQVTSSRDRDAAGNYTGWRNLNLRWFNPLPTEEETEAD